MMKLWKDLKIVLKGWTIFFTVNGIKEENKISFFCSIMGPTLYTKLKYLLHPKKVSDVDFLKLLKPSRPTMYPSIMKDLYSINALKNMERIFQIILVS